MAVVTQKRRVIWTSALLALVAIVGVVSAAQSIKSLYIIPRWTKPTGASRPPLITPTRPPLISPIRP